MLEISSEENVQTGQINGVQNFIMQSTDFKKMSELASVKILKVQISRF